MKVDDPIAKLLFQELTVCEQKLFQADIELRNRDFAVNDQREKVRRLQLAIKILKEGHI